MNTDDPRKGHIWRHFKGNEYLILGVATPQFSTNLNILYYAKDSEDFSLHPIICEANKLLIKRSANFRDYRNSYVIYQDLEDKSKIWARELNNFRSIVKVSEYVSQERFQLVGFVNESASARQP